MAEKIVIDLRPGELGLGDFSDVLVEEAPVLNADCLDGPRSDTQVPNP